MVGRPYVHKDGQDILGKKNICSEAFGLMVHCVLTLTGWGHMTVLWRVIVFSSLPFFKSMEEKTR